MLLGYARVSTHKQNLDIQIDMLNKHGVDSVFSEVASGAQRERSELTRLLEYMRKGDVLVVCKYDRLARRLPVLLDIVNTVQSKGGGFQSLAEDIDTTSAAGQLVFHVFASIAEFERARISERTHEGLAIARKAGRIGGRPQALTAEQKREAYRLRWQEGWTIHRIANLFGVSARTLRRHTQ